MRHDRVVCVLACLTHYLHFFPGVWAQPTMFTGDKRAALERCLPVFLASFEQPDDAPMRAFLRDLCDPETDWFEDVVNEMLRTRKQAALWEPQTHYALATLCGVAHPRLSVYAKKEDWTDEVCLAALLDDMMITAENMGRENAEWAEDHAHTLQGGTWARWCACDVCTAVRADPSVWKETESDDDCMDEDGAVSAYDDFKFAEAVEKWFESREACGAGCC